MKVHWDPGIRGYLTPHLQDSHRPGRNSPAQPGHHPGPCSGTRAVPAAPAPALPAPVEVAAVQPHHDPAVGQNRVVRLEVPHVLELALGHGEAAAAARGARSAAGSDGRGRPAAVQHDRHGSGRSGAEPFWAARSSARWCRRRAGGAGGRSAGRLRQRCLWQRRGAEPGLGTRAPRSERAEQRAWDGRSGRPHRWARDGGAARPSRRGWGSVRAPRLVRDAGSVRAGGAGPPGALAQRWRRPRSGGGAMERRVRHCRFRARASPASPPRHREVMGPLGGLRVQVQEHPNRPGHSEGAAKKSRCISAPAAVEKEARGAIRRERDHERGSGDRQNEENVLEQSGNKAWRRAAVQAERPNVAYEARPVKMEKSDAPATSLCELGNPPQDQNIPVLFQSLPSRSHVQLQGPLPSQLMHVTPVPVKQVPVQLQPLLPRPKIETKNVPLTVLPSDSGIRELAGWHTGDTWWHARDMLSGRRTQGERSC